MLTRALVACCEQGGPGDEEALAKKFGGARALWDEGVCARTQSHHMCVGPCDAWQPRDPTTKLPLMEPVWKYLLTNTEPPSAKVREPSLLTLYRRSGRSHSVAAVICQALSLVALSTMKNYTPPCQMHQGTGAIDPGRRIIDAYHEDAATASALGAGGVSVSWEGGYPKPQVVPSCCQHDCAKHCVNCEAKNGTCAIC